jgi:Pyruvate/2-oxoacid:ferredoxin oxidoreductase delta subunit
MSLLEPLSQLSAHHLNPEDPMTSREFVLKAAVVCVMGGYMLLSPVKRAEAKMFSCSTCSTTCPDDLELLSIGV